MIKFELTEVVGWEHAIRGMRNAMNAWDKIDSGWSNGYISDDHIPVQWCGFDEEFQVGPNDQNRMMSLRKAGTDHRKYMRMIIVYVDITAPLYWWKEFDTYKVGTVANSCSTMHKLTAKEFELDDFSHEHLTGAPLYYLKNVVETLNGCRSQYLICKAKLNNKELQLTQAERKHIKAQQKHWWWQMIQLLPSSYNQRRTIMFNYEVLANMYHSRDGHPLDEWNVDFINWIRTLPDYELITGEANIDERFVSAGGVNIIRNNPNPHPSDKDYELHMKVSKEGQENEKD